MEQVNNLLEIYNIELVCDACEVNKKRNGKKKRRIRKTNNYRDNSKPFPQIVTPVMNTPINK